jgi:hypothetical protein
MRQIGLSWSVGTTNYSQGMLLENDDVQEFKSIYEQEFGETISDGQARIMASQFLRLYEALARPLPSEKDRLLASSPGTAMLE